MARFIPVLVSFIVIYSFTYVADGASVVEFERRTIIKHLGPVKISKTPTPNTDRKTQKCGYQSCNAVKDGMLNVHLVPHTHDDVGWLKTVDQYYYGSRRSITKVGVQYILDTAISQLLLDPTRRFIYVEIAFFKRWWDEQTAIMRRTVTQLVNEGRLEFILGGWSMNDEAATHYNAIIDQHTLGLQFLHDTFGECGRPRVAWQIDPFGHSREMASLFAQMGYDALFNGRIDYEDRDKRKNDHSMEMVWQGSPNNLGDSANLFTGILNTSYSPPKGFCFDVFCNDEPIMDDPALHDYNVNERVDEFLRQVEYQRVNYKTRHIMMTMGEDFNYVDAVVWFKNLDKLIHFVNARQHNGSSINLLYSTPSCYLHQLFLSNLTWPTKSDDFLPYAHRPHAFWTGYFTSRPTHKRFSRYGNNVHQVVKQLSVFTLITDSALLAGIKKLREAMGVVQHHDAITGTAKQHVANDYAERLSSGIQAGQDVLTHAFNTILPLSTKHSRVPISYCNLLNISECVTSESQSHFAVIVYNPLARPISDFVRLPVANQHSYSVQNAAGDNLSAQVSDIPPWIRKIPERHSPAARQLLFPTQLPALGFSTYFISKQDLKSPTFHKGDQVLSNGDVVISNEILSLTFDAASHKLKSLHNSQSNTTVPFTVEFGYYIGHSGDNRTPDTQASGAYIFRPLRQEATIFSNVTIIKVIRNDLVQEIWQGHSSWVHQVTRLYKGCPYMEIEWTVGPISIEDKLGREIIVRYTSRDMDNQRVFYTDANGREIISRMRDHRPTWTLTTSEPISSNYYPVNSRIYIQDKKKDTQLTVLTDRSQGGSSLQDGHIELMLHRRLLHDDSLGVGEALNESGSDGRGLIVTGNHYVIMGGIKESARLHRELALQKYLAPVVSFVPDITREEWTKLYASNWSGIAHNSLPRNVHLLTLEEWGDGKCLVRLEHIYENGEDAELSRNVTVNLENVFRTFKVVSLVELSLGANQNKSDMHRLKWRTEKQQAPQDYDMMDHSTTDLNITLSPMQIRTFLVRIKPS